MYYPSHLARCHTYRCVITWVSVYHRYDVWRWLAVITPTWVYRCVVWPLMSVYTTAGGSGETGKRGEKYREIIGEIIIYM